MQHYEQVAIAYAKLADMLLTLKAQGISDNALRSAIERAMREAGLS